MLSVVVLLSIFFPHTRLSFVYCMDSTCNLCFESSDSILSNGLFPNKSSPVDICVSIACF